MHILAIETTCSVGSVAIIDMDYDFSEIASYGLRNDYIVGSQSSHTASIPIKITTEPMGHLRNLTPMAEKLLIENNLKMKDIGAIAVSAGPGSFTGIRIGVSTARALVQALDVPGIQVQTLEVFKLRAKRARNALTVPIFNARRGQVYSAIYDSEQNEIMKPQACMLEDVFAVIDKSAEKAFFYGDGVDAYEKMLAGYDKADKSVRYQTADMVAATALKMYRKGLTVDCNALLPLYMRRTEAEMRLEDGSLERARKARMEKFRNGGM